MNSMLRILLLSCFVAGSTLAAPTKFERLKVGSDIYTNVTVVSFSATDLYFSHEKGIKNVKLRNLEPDVQKLFDYNPQTAADMEKQQTQDDARFQGSVAARIATQGAARGARGATDANAKRRTSSEENLADPISDQSPIGKPGPALEIEKWSGSAPVLKGKFVLLTFLTPWSVPCQKWIPQLNGLQTKLGEKLQVVGLVPEADAEDGSLDSKIDFPSAVDAKGKIQAAVGVKSVPYVLLMDPRGVIVYEGHPAALGEKELKLILAKPPASDSK
jgi:thiol-disulfide isomerase/thioredoxin